MKTMFTQSRRPGRASEAGSILLFTLGFALVAGLTISSYLILADQEHRVVLRSQNWNGALTLAEAGVDEALAQMNYSPANFSANGWGGAAGTNGSDGPVTRTLTGGSYSVSIVNGPVPTIYATGYVAVADTGQTVTRAVKVTTTTMQVSPFSVGLGAVGNINMNGNSVASDSWNSHTNILSTNGLYSTSMISSNGDVASEQGIVNIGNHTIYGSLYLGPTASYSSGNSQVTGTIYYDANIQFPDVTLPTTDANGNPVTWLTPPVVNLGTSKKPNNVYDFTSANNNGYYVISDSTSVQVEPGVTVTLQVTTENFSPSTVTINGGTTNSGSIVMYDNPPTTGGSATISGNSAGGGVGNRPENFVYFGTPNVTSITMSGTSTYVGAVYAPEAVLTLNGGGNSNDLMGSAIVNSVTLNGHYNFHYDLALGMLRFGVNRGYLVTSWQEIASGH